MQHKLPYALVAALLVASCETSRYHIANDHAPVREPRSEELVDAIPTGEKPSVQGNRPYTVRGKRYYPIKPIEGYTEVGEASWYGNKFHGHLTANGEVYDMFKMTAAHTTLPLPSYIKVTNLNTSLSVVVRVNDRGPFHHKRVLDLSYAAAYKIGLTKTGVAPVRIELITNRVVPDSLARTADAEQSSSVTATTASTTPRIVATPKTPLLNTESNTTNQADTHGPTIIEASRAKEMSMQTCSMFNDALTGVYVVQLITTASFDKLQSVAKKLPAITTANGKSECFYQTLNKDSKRLYRLVLGPYADYAQAQSVQQQLESAHVDKGFIRKL